MYDTVNMWVSGVDISGGNPFEVLPRLTLDRQRSQGGHGERVSDEQATG